MVHPLGSPAGGALNQRPFNRVGAEQQSLANAQAWNAPGLSFPLQPGKG